MAEIDGRNSRFFFREDCEIVRRRGIAIRGGQRMTARMERPGAD